MDKNKKMITIFISGAAVLTVLTFAVYFLTERGAGADFYMPVYFFNSSTGSLEPEEHGTAIAVEPNILIDEAVKAVFSPPRSAVLSRPWPAAEEFLIGYAMNGNILEMKFTAAYNELAPVDEALLRTALVMTMTKLPTVNYIRILPEDSEAGTGYLSAENYSVNPTISPNKITSRVFTLYFVNDTNDGLVKRTHTSDRVDMDQEEIYIINQIIAGQTDEGVFPAIPPETKVSIELDRNTSTCYVNLSSEIERFNGSTSLAELMLYSIVNSLTENLVHVRRVQFQIDSQIVDQFYGVTNFNQVFEKNEDLAVE